MSVDPNMTRQDMTPYNESRALKKKLEGVRVHSLNQPNGAPVPVNFVSPDLELVKASYPGIYISYAGMSKANDREVRGPVAFGYAPSGYDQHVQVPVDMDDKDSDATEDWAESFDRLKSPYRAEDHPIPYNLDFNVTAISRTYQQMFEIISTLDEIDYLPARFGGLEVPEDGTIRTLDLLGGPDISVTSDEDGKRMVQTVYSVRVAAELSLYEVQQVTRVLNVDLDLVPFHPYL